MTANGTGGTGGAMTSHGTGGTGGAMTSQGTGGTGGSGNAGTGGGTSSGVYRPFNDTSPWNTPVGANPSIDPSSQALIADLATSTAQWNYLGINIDTYSIPVYYIDSSQTPTYTVKCGTIGQAFDMPVPIPNGAMPDSQTDHHLCMVDKAKGVEWGMWDAALGNNNMWTAGVGATADLTGSGVRPPITTANPWTLAVSGRASGFPLIAGLIRVEEIMAGKIEHALVIAYPHCRSRYFVPPASTAQGTTSDALPTRGIPMGGHIQLDPSINVDGLGLTKSGAVIAHALQDYGAFVGDYSGSINLYAENAPDAVAAWNGGLLTTYEISTIFNQAMLMKFRVLTLPTFLDNNN